MSFQIDRNQARETTRIVSHTRDGFTKCFGSYHDHNLSTGPLPMDTLNDLGQSFSVDRGRDIVRRILVVCTDIDDHKVRRGLLAKIPRLWVFCDG